MDDKKTALATASPSTSQGRQMAIVLMSDGQSNMGPELLKMAELAAKQAAILDAAAKLVRPGGRVVYATCSLLPQENQQIAGDFLAKHPNFELVPAAEVLKPLFPKDKIPLGCSPDNPWWQLWPHIHGTDGFFGAVFQKKAAAPVEKIDQGDEKGGEKETKIKTKKVAKELK